MKNKMKNNRFWLTVIASTLMFPTIGFAHPFHFSSMEMEWNSKTNAFEVSVQLDPNDIERELRLFSKQKIVLEKLATTKVSGEHPVFQYLNKVFAANYNGQQLKLKPVGFEVETKNAWIYFELPADTVDSPLKFETLRIMNKLLINQHAQTNHLTLKVGQQNISTTFLERKTTTTFKRDLMSKRLISF